MLNWDYLRLEYPNEVGHKVGYIVLDCGVLKDSNEDGNKVGYIAVDYGVLKSPNEVGCKVSYMVSISSYFIC